MEKGIKKYEKERKDKIFFKELLSKKKIIIGASILSALLLVVFSIFIIKNDPLGSDRKAYKFLKRAIDNTQKQSDFMMTANLSYSQTYNDIVNKTVTQGVLMQSEHKKNMSVQGDIDFTCSSDSTRDFKTSFRVMKKNNRVYEKPTSEAEYIESDISVSEFNKLCKNFKIFISEFKNIESITKSDSVDKKTAIVEITLSGLSEEMMEDYLNTINEGTNADFKIDDIHFSSGMVKASISNGVLKSQQVRLAITAGNSIDKVYIGYISEINISQDNSIIKKQFE